MLVLVLDWNYIWKGVARGHMRPRAAYLKLGSNIVKIVLVLALVALIMVVVGVSGRGGGGGAEGGGGGDGGAMV